MQGAALRLWYRVGAFGFAEPFGGIARDPGLDRFLVLVDAVEASVAAADLAIDSAWFLSLSVATLPVSVTTPFSRSWLTLTSL